MTIQLTKATYVSGVLAAAGSQHTLDAETEAYLVHIGAATWVDAAYTQGRFEDAKIEYPDGKEVKDKVVGDYRTYEGKFTIKATVKRAKGDTNPLEMELAYQACNDMSCLPPAKTKLKAE